MHPALATRPEPLPPQDQLDLARLSRLQHAAKRAETALAVGDRTSYYRNLAEVQETTHELTSWVRR